MRAVGRATTRSRTRQWVRFGLKARPRWHTHARGHLASRAAVWPWRTCSPWRRRVRVTAGCGVTRRRSNGSMHKRIRRGTFGHLQEAQLQEAHRRHKAHAEQQNRGGERGQRDDGSPAGSWRKGSVPWPGAAATTRSSAVQRCFADGVVRGRRRGGGPWRRRGVVALLLLDFSLGAGAVELLPLLRGAGSSLLGVTAASSSFFPSLLLLLASPPLPWFGAPPLFLDGGGGGADWGEEGGV